MVKDESLRAHGGWHPGYIFQTVNDYPAEWRRFLEQAQSIWQVSPESVGFGGGLTVILYCNAGVTRSVALSRVLAFLLQAYPPPGCAGGHRVSLWHLSHREPRGSPDCGGFCEKCCSDIPEEVAAQIVRDFCRVP